MASPSRLAILPPAQICIAVDARECVLTSVSPGLHLVEWTRFNVDLPEVGAAHKVQQSGPEIELACGGIGEIGFCQTPMLRGELNVLSFRFSGWCDRLQRGS